MRLASENNFRNLCDISSWEKRFSSLMGILLGIFRHCKFNEIFTIVSGLTARSILKIYKLITPPKILYGVSAWSDCNLDPLITLQRAWLYSATGSFYNPANCDLELLTDITPIKIQVELKTAKFLAKLYVKGDNLKHTIFDPNTANPKINNDVTILKRFLAFKNNLRSSHRLELDEIDVQTFQYGKSDINRYEHHLWVNYWLYQDSHLRRIFHIPPSSRHTLEKMKSTLSDS